MTTENLTKANNSNHSVALTTLKIGADVINGRVTSQELIKSLDFDKLFKFCKFHSVGALVCYGIEQSIHSHSILLDENIREQLKKFQEVKSKSVRKNVMLDIERGSLFSFMEQNGIWHMSLKGIVIKDMYPKLGLREMNDNDILFDKLYREKIKEWFVSRDYEIETFDKWIHDTYRKLPVFEFEMHISLFQETKYPELSKYYENIKGKLIKLENKNYEYKFTDEDYYIYMMLHSFKHYENGGVGLRHLFDTMIYLKEKHSILDWKYIKKELQKLNIENFEILSKSLALKMLSFENIDDFVFTLSEEEKQMLQFIVKSGTFGIVENLISTRIQKQGKAKYIKERLFPSKKYMKFYYSKFTKPIILLPIGYAYRLVKGMFRKRHYIQKERTLLKK